MEYPDPPLRDERILLRPFRTDDFPAAAQADEDSTTARWVNPLPGSDAEETARFLEDERRAGTWLHLVVADRASDRYLGEIVLLPRPHDVVEIAYVVGPSARGRGIATAAVRLLVRWAVTGLGVARLELRIEPANVASVRVAEKLGFVREGLLRSAALVRGRRRDVAIYALLAAEAGDDLEMRA